MLIIILFFSLAILNSEAFKTAKCDHETTAADLVDLDNCLNYRDTKTNEDAGLCGFFQPYHQCLTKHLEECLDDDQVQKAANETLAQKRK